jgi:hypothetical protein
MAIGKEQAQQLRIGDVVWVSVSQRPVPLRVVAPFAENATGWWVSVLLRGGGSKRVRPTAVLWRGTVNGENNDRFFLTRAEAEA